METPLNFNGKKHLPVPSGQYVVGVMDLMTGLKPTDEDSCFVRLYYPCEAKEIYAHASDWASWLPDSKYIEGFCSVIPLLRIAPFIGKKLVSLVFNNRYCPVVVNALPINQKTFPIIVFSHGIYACRTTSSMIYSELASNGFIVAALEHRDGSGCLSYTLQKNPTTGGVEKDWILHDVMPFQKNELPQRLEQLKCRIRECRSALDLLIKINNGEAIEHLLIATVNLNHFRGLMDVSQPVIAGHSFGSATLLRTLAVEKRFKLGVALDAWMWPLQNEVELQNQIEQSILFINSMAYFQSPFTLALMKRYLKPCNLTTERKVLTIRGSVHRNQTDIPFVMHRYLRGFAEARSTIDPHLAMDLNNRLILQFLRKQLNLPNKDEHSNFLEKHKEFINEGLL